MDAYEVLEEGCDHIIEGDDDSNFFEMDIDETVMIDPDEVHHDMFHDFDQINEDDLPY
jgi:hypothetical protein